MSTIPTSSQVHIDTYDTENTAYAQQTSDTFMIHDGVVAHYSVLLTYDFSYS